MCGDISTQAYDIIWSRSKLQNTLSALKTCLKSGAAGNIKNIISGYSGLFKDEHELEEAVALECAVALSGNKNVFKDASSIIDTDYSYTSLAYDLPKNWYQDQELVKKFAQKSAKKSRFTETQVRKAVNDTKKSWTKTDKMFKAAGVGIDLAEAVMLDLGTIQVQEEVVDALLANVPEGNALYNGLKRIDTKQQKTWSQNIAEQFLTERIADGLASMGADSLKDIGGEAFSGCSSLTDIKLPDKIENIDSTAFSGIDSITVTAADKTAGRTFAEDSSNAVADVCEPAVTGIELKKAPDAKECRMSEDPDLTGLSVEATFENGTSKDVSDDVYCYIKDKKIGTSTVKVVYDDKETSFDIDVIADKCSYKVSYEDEYGDKIADQTTGEAEAGTKVIIISPEIKGYTPVNEKNEFTVGMDSEFTVSYRTVPKKDIADAKVSIAAVEPYDGSQKKPSVTAEYEGKRLTGGTDYTVEYGGNTDAGKGLITIYGTGDYTGLKDVEFDISPADISRCTVKLAASSYAYSGKTKKPAVTATTGGTRLTGDDYTVTYADGRKNVGRYKVTVKCRGNYTGTKTLYFTINPRSTAISKLTKGKKSFKVSSQATGYQIQYATSSKFTRNRKSVTIKSYKTTSKNITKLKAKKKYYVRVRTYRKVGKTTYYSGWSKTKTVKTK